MHGLPELRIPNDWKQRTRVFLTPAKRRRPGLTPLVPREVYDAEREPSAPLGRDDGRDDDRVRRDRFIHTRQ
jgi:hypothetical protein